MKAADPGFEELEKPGDRLTERQALAIHLRHEFALRHVAGKRVLDVGCGPGFGLRLFAERAASVLAVDLDESAIAFAKRVSHPRLKVARADACAIPSEAASFDVVICLAVLMYLDLDSFLAECRRILAPGGMIVGVAANPSTAGFVPSRHWKHYPTLPRLDAELRRGGFHPAFWGVRYGISEGRKTLSSSLYGLGAPVLMRLINLLPNPRAIKSVITRIVSAHRLDTDLSLEALNRALAQCEIVELPPVQELAIRNVEEYESFFFVAKKSRE